MRFARASRTEVQSFGGWYNVVSLWKRAFVISSSMRPSGACNMISLLEGGWQVILYDPDDMASRSGLIGQVVNVVCFGCHPRDCGVVVGGEALTFSRIGVLFVW